MLFGVNILSTWSSGADSPDHEIARHVKEGRPREKRYRFKGFGGTHPFYPAQSFAIYRGSVYKRTNLWAGYPRHGWFSGFSEGFEGHDAAGKLFYINRGLTGGVHWTRLLPEEERRKKNYPRAWGDPPRKCEPQFAPLARQIRRYIQLALALRTGSNYVCYFDG